MVTLNKSQCELGWELFRRPVYRRLSPKSVVMVDFQVNFGLIQSEKEARSREERLEMLREMQIEILDGQSSHLFSNEPFEKRPLMTMEDFVLHPNDHFESHLLGNEE